MALRTVAAALAASSISLTAASAADLPSRKAPIVPPPPMLLNWTGLYVGVNIGGTFGAGNTAIVGLPISNSGPPFGAAQQAANDLGLTFPGIGGSRGGFIGGGQIGWNYQISPAFVAGLEADIQGIAGNSSSFNLINSTPVQIAGAPNLTTLGAASSRLRYLATVRGRLGFLAAPTLLLYATGGLAFGGVSSSLLVSQNANVAFATQSFGSISQSSTRLGWTLGAGAEWMFAPNWSVKAEYLYYDLGSVSAFSTPLTINTFGAPFTTDVAQMRTRFNGHVVRAGLNYHFSWGGQGPVVAQY